jgi:adenosylcobinamide-GDP ribazoletransferase
MRSFLVALSFLTIFPVRFREMPAPRDLARSRFWYPVVGLLLGATLAVGCAAMTAAWHAPLIAAFLLLVAWVILTGALHLDGFCDLCDGLFGGHTPQERLRILRDPHLGTFGLAGGVLLLLGKFAFLYELIASQPARTPWVVGAAIVMARCLVLSVAAGARYPREQGTGKIIVEATRWPEAILFALLAGGVATLPFPPAEMANALVLWLPLMPTVGLLRWLCWHRLGGVTGDCLGAAIELLEALVLLAATLIVAGPAPSTGEELRGGARGHQAEAPDQSWRNGMCPRMTSASHSSSSGQSVAQVPKSAMC